MTYKQTHSKDRHRAAGGFGARLEQVLDRVFVHREILLRSNDQVRYLKLSPRLQKCAALAMAAGFGWMVFSSFSYVSHGDVVATKVEEIETAKRAYFDLLTEVSEYHAQFSEITRDLESNQSYLLTLLEERPESAEADLDSVAERLQNSREARARVVVAREALRERLDSFQGELQEIAGRNAELQAQVQLMNRSLRASEAERVQVAEARRRLGQRLRETEGTLNATREERTALSGRVAQLEGKLAESEADVTSLSSQRQSLVKQVADLRTRLTSAQTREAELIASAQEREAELLAQSEARLQELTAQAEHREATLNEEIDELGSNLAQIREQKDGINRERNMLQLRLAGLQQRMTDMREVQQGIVDRLQVRTQTTVEAMEATVEVTGLDLEAVLEKIDSSDLGKGGPFIPVDGVYQDAHPGRADELMTAVARLDIQMSRWEALQALMSVLPLSAPLQEYRLSSTFGERTDPVNGRKAVHYGLDMAAPLRTPTLATAPGVVSFAGWRGNYGRLVEIDHGFGIKTRYGHLKKIEVEVGQAVSTQDIIGLVGSSGRSTGPHVHYEVIYEDAPLDPQRFIDAGVRIFKEDIGSATASAKLALEEEN
ncbi:MAG: peptidoglycan DD-metalloendopeptidase family protein [Rhodovibrionaceae bacterium]